jgi:hypothetical protein
MRTKNCTLFAAEWLKILEKNVLPGEYCLPYRPPAGEIVKQV